MRKIIPLFAFILLCNIAFCQSKSTNTQSIKGKSQAKMTFLQYDNSPEDSLLMEMEFVIKSTQEIKKGDNLNIKVLRGNYSFPCIDVFEKEYATGTNYKCTFLCSKSSIEEVTFSTFERAKIKTDDTNLFIDMVPISFGDAISKCFTEWEIMSSVAQPDKVQNTSTVVAVKDPVRIGKSNSNYYKLSPTSSIDWNHIPNMEFPSCGFRDPYHLSWYCSNMAEKRLRQFANNETAGFCLTVVGGGLIVAGAGMKDVVAVGCVIGFAGLVFDVIGFYDLMHHFKWNYRKKQVDFYLSPTSATLKF